MNDIWHTKKEKPTEDKTVFAQHKSFRDGSIECFMWEKQEFTDAIRKDVIAWCYLDELITCEQELIRTRKALDVALDRLTTIGGYLDYNDCVRVALDAKDEIYKILEQKDVKCETPPENVQSDTKSRPVNVQKKMTPEEFAELELLVNATFK